MGFILVLFYGWVPFPEITFGSERLEPGYTQIRSFGSTLSLLFIPSYNMFRRPVRITYTRAVLMTSGHQVGALLN